LNTPYYTILTGGGKCLIYFIYVYLIGRYIRLHNDVDYNPRFTLGLFLLISLLIVLLNLLVGYIFKKPCSIYSMDCSPLILMSALSVFYLFKSLSFSSSLVNYISSSVLAVYLLDGMRLAVNSHIISWSDKGEEWDCGLYLIMGVFITFLIAIAIDKVRILIFGFIEKRLINIILQIGAQMETRIQHVYKKYK